MAATLLAFTRARQPGGLLGKIPLPAHAQAACVEIIAAYYGDMHGRLEAEHATRKELTDASEAALACINTAIRDVEKFGKHAFRKSHIPAPVYCAALMVCLAAGNEDPVTRTWQQQHAIKGAELVRDSRDFDYERRQPDDAAGRIPQIVFVREFALAFALRRLGQSLEKLPAGSKPVSPASFDAYVQATQLRRSPSHLSAHISVLASQVRRLAENPAARRAFTP